MKTKKMDLLEGQFSADEVKEVINNLYKGQMEYYKLRYLQDIERKDQGQQTLQELEALRQKKEILNKYFSETDKNLSSSVRVCLEISQV